MGYDMYRQTKPNPERSAEIRAELDAEFAVGRDNIDRSDEAQARREKMWAEQAEADGYFRLNVWGMQTAREELWNVGVVRAAIDEHTWPEPIDFGFLDTEDVWEYIDLDSDRPHKPLPEWADDERVIAWLAATTEHTDGPDGEGPGIPVYKFGSNDGWLVSPTEMKSGLAYADEHHPGWRDGLTDFVLEFVKYMESCVEADDGFRVY